ncbi:MAG: helix-turn-helix domain-containing protein [Clostridia bacterium]|nr:helix-turn-helix domain-containing protein [Clostridia bacterium]MBQ6467258.1 helix-turn-helix domain-containing protein [Clostridia bacterium]MBR6335881.1 helix-turn-helix domain-containing protein [Clostridia bacterium]
MNRIKEMRKNARLSQLELAQLCGVHQTAVSQWEQGRTNPDMETLMVLTQIFHTSIGALMGLDTPDDPVMIPVKGLVQAGEMTFIEEEDICEFVAISPDLAMRGEYCGLRVKGDSMYPLFHDEDIVVVRVQNEAENNDVVVAIEGRERATLKRLKYQKNGLMLIAENPEYDSIFYTKEQVARLPVTIFGKAVEIRREVR